MKRYRVDIYWLSDQKFSGALCKTKEAADEFIAETLRKWPGDEKTEISIREYSKNFETLVSSVYY